MYLESMVDAILKGMGEQLATFRYSVLDSILRIAGILWLMPQYGMPGFLAVMTASNLLTCGLNTGRMVRQLGERKSELRGKLGIRNEELEIGRRGDGKKINNNE
jgi:stage V sporulation protein B